MDAIDAILKFEKNPEDDFYNILGCDELSTVGQITAEYRSRVLDCHPDRQPGDPQAEIKFKKLQKAKEVLCDPEMRADYDNWRRCGISVTFEEWRARKGAIHTSLHWASKVKKEPMLEGPPSQTSSTCWRETDGSLNTDGSTCPWSKSAWHQDKPSEMLRRFRSYDL